MHTSMNTATDFILNVVARKSDEMLEPCEGKLSCTVLRRERGSNPSDLVDYITMIILLLGSILLMYLLNQSWYKTLMFTKFWKILLAICGAVIFVSIGAVAKHTRPIENIR